MYSDVFCYDYNWTVLLVTLIILYVELKNKGENLYFNFKKDLSLGILAGMSILLKQSTGLILSIAFIGYKILEIRKKEDFKKYFKIIGARLLGVLSPIVIFIIYLICENIWINFIDYAIAGIKTFSNTVSYKTLLDAGMYLAYVIPALLTIYTILIIFTLFKKNLRDKTWVKNLRILLVYDLASFCIIYPISDKNHFAIGTICTIITSVYLVYEIIKYYLKKENSKKLIFALKTFFETVSILILLGLMGKSIYSLTNYLADIKNQTYLEHFNYITTEEGLQNNINAVDKYILDKKEKGQEVYILDTRAAVYMIPVNEYHKDYDMFNLGNFGGKGEEGIIEDLESKKNLLLLVLKDDYSLNWQMPKNVINYVKENYKFVDSIQIFDVYIK